MKSNPKITVIMPSLNVAKYIKPCVESVLGQTMSEFEILAIDAGSTDGTWEVLQEFAQHDDRVQVIKSDLKSYGYQVNLGLSLAKGDYIAIVETDDLIDSQMFEKLYNLATMHDLDYVKGDYAYFVELQNSARYQNVMRMFPLNSELYDAVLNPQKHKELCYTDIYLWKGLYNRSFLVDNNIRLNETKGAAFQDIGFLFQTFAYATRAMYVKDVYYYYRQDNGGASIVNSNGFMYLVAEYKFLRNFLAEHELWDVEWKAHYYTRMFQQIVARYRTMAAFGQVWENCASERAVLRTMITEAYQDGLINESAFWDGLWLELLQYIEDEETYWVHQKSIYAGRKALLSEIKALTAAKKEIVFYSTSVRNDFLVALINQMIPDAKICYCDNNPERQGTQRNGYMVYSVEEAVRLHPDAVYLIGNRRYDSSMKKQLVDLGVPQSKIRVSKMEFDLLMLHAAAGMK